MKNKAFVFIILCFSLSSCVNYTNFIFCSDNYEGVQKCEIVAKFRDLESCLKYRIIYNSLINYDDLVKEGQTLVRYEQSSLTFKYKAQLYCEK